MLSDNIRSYRKKNNLSQDELAEKIGVSRQSVSFWETGQTQPTIDNIIALSRIFNISSDELLGNTENINTTQNEASVGSAKNKKNKTPWFVLIGIIIAVIICVIIILLLPSGNGSPAKDDSDGDAESHSVIQSDASYANSLPDENSRGNPGLTSSEASDESGESASSDESDPQSGSSPDESENTASDNNQDNSGPASSDESDPQSGSSPDESESSASDNNQDNSGPASSDESDPQSGSSSDESENTTSDNSEAPFDLFSYCRDFAIEKGELNGDYCIYQQPAAKYGGYSNEYFSISYWSDSDMVEFCLHCPLDQTLSHNFYIRMRGGYNKKYEYLSSKYFRDTGESLRAATGYIDPAVFSDGYPISCDEYYGSFEGQNQFMEDTRVGICDLIKLLKEFVTVENMECDFSDFDFIHF